jgi:hypothetical protein
MAGILDAMARTWMSVYSRWMYSKYHVGYSKANFLERKNMSKTRSRDFERRKTEIPDQFKTPIS